ncbi:hypothetical protein Leryth_025800 [Lithospermum erythrorhizon]|uniref:Uncharacterized protein n=1 Tax=Lithospermum erythrorhizon TaxID=34254 RepID=A0AAV3QIJ6_LITER|nr:hypothetical protein Leryth_025800 [Lithospermum erythrorhizon]
MLSYYGVINSTIPLHICSTSTNKLNPHTRYPLIQANHKKKETYKQVHCNGNHSPLFVATLGALASIIIISAGNAEAIGLSLAEKQQRQQQQHEQEQGETLANIPEELSGLCDAGNQDCNKKGRIQRPKSKQAETCTVKCVNTCIRGGSGSPGEGPLNIRRPIVVFKQGFHSRRYCLVECSDICNLIKDGDDGP